MIKKVLKNNDTNTYIITMNNGKVYAMFFDRYNTMIIEQINKPLYIFYNTRFKHGEIKAIYSKELDTFVKNISCINESKEMDIAIVGSELVNIPFNGSSNTPNIITSQSIDSSDLEEVSIRTITNDNNIYVAVIHNNIILRMDIIADTIKVQMFDDSDSVIDFITFVE